MIRTGPAGYPEGSRTPAEGVRLVRKAGLQALELQFVRNVQFNPDRAEEARKAAQELDVALSAHAPYYVNLSSPSELTREKSEEWVLKALRGAEAFGAWVVVVHAATYGDKGAERTTAMVIDSLRRVRERAKDESLTAMIGLETMGKRAVWGTVPEIMSVMDEVESVVPVLDFAHLQARGPDRLNAEKLQGVLDDLNGVVRLHCHISGIEYTEAGERKHLRLGEGLDHRMVLSALQGRGRETTVICESTAPLEDAQLMQGFLDGKII
ncbi:MAG: TIM barrel protein [Methanomassiliicoccales archaeon]|nr:TIM barrel protein [Methanomassiliicoccales archaeon]